MHMQNHKAYLKVEFDGNYKSMQKDYEIPAQCLIF